jgi:hypothetical protein
MARLPILRIMNSNKGWVMNHAIRQRARVWIGILVWTVLGIAGGWYLIRDFVGSSRGTFKQIATFVAAPRQVLELEFPSPQILRPGESIFQRREGRYHRIGEIVSKQPYPEDTPSSPWTMRATAVIYSSSAPIADGDQLTYIPATESMTWVVASLLTPERRARINDLLRNAYLEHRNELLAHFGPLLEETLREASIVIWEDLQQIAPEYDEQWSAIGERYRADLVEKRLVPLLQEVIWPIVVAESQPLLNQMGEEIWNRTSVWGFGWRAMYDVLPLPQRDLTRHEFERFVQTEALPVVEEHLNDILDLQQQIFSRIAADPQVQAELAASLRHVLQDEEAQGLALGMLQRVMTNNPRLNKVVMDIWSSPRATYLVDLANDRLDFTIASIGEELFGNPYTAITPEFSRVLRYKILHKDSQWLLLDRKGGQRRAESIQVHVGLPSIENPFHVPAEQRK